MKKIYSLIALGGALLMPTQSYALDSIDQLTGDASLIAVYENNPWDGYKSLKIAAGQNPNEIILQGIYSIQGSEIPATVDLEAGTVTFKSIENCFYMEQYQGWANFQVFQYNKTHTRYNPVEETVATIAADGTGNIFFDPEYLIGVIVPEGVNPNPGGMGGEPGDQTPGEQVIFVAGSDDDKTMYIQGVKRQWTYYADEWELAGKASYQDGWIAPFIGYNNGSKELVYLVDYYVNKEDPAKILIANPYDNAAYTTTSVADYKNTGSGQGFIFIDSTDPDFVQVMWHVPAGYSCEALGDNIECYNEEGYNRCCDGCDIAQCKANLRYFDYNIFSTRNGDDIEIRNLDFTSSLYGNLYAGHPSGASMDAVTYITLNAEDLPDQPGTEDPSVNVIPSGAELFPYHFSYYSQLKGLDVTGNVDMALEDGIVYFKGLLPSNPEFVVIGDYDEDTAVITIPQGQIIGNIDGDDVYINYLTWNLWTGAWDYPSAEYGYQLQVDEDGNMQAVTDPTGYNQYYLGIRTATAYVDYVRDVVIEEGYLAPDTTWDAEGKTIYTMPEGVEPLTYILSGTFEHDNGHTTSFVDVAFDGGYIYVKGLSYHMPDAVVRMEYDAAEGRAYLPQTQLVGYYDGEPYFTRFYEFSFSTYTIVPLPVETPYVFTVNPETGVITYPSPNDAYIYVGFYNPDVRSLSTFAYGCLELIAAVRLTPYVDRSGTPANPFDLEYDANFDEFNYMVPNYTTDGVEMDTRGLFMKIYINGEPLWFEGPGYDPDTFEPLEGPYQGTNGTYLLPYGASNDIDIFANGMGHTLVIYEDNVETISVQSVYVYSDLQYPEETTTYSDTVTLNVLTGEITIGDISSGIGNILSGSVVSTEYYTIGGQKVNNPEKGVYIMRSTLSDGKVVVKKVIR